MEKVRIMVHCDHAQEMLSLAQRMHVLALEEVSLSKEERALFLAHTKKREPSFVYTHRANDIDFALSFLQKRFPKKLSLREKIEGVQKIIPESEVKRVVETLDTAALAHELALLEARENTLSVQRKKLLEEKALFLPWRKSNLTTAYTKTKRTTMLAVSADHAEMERVSNALTEAGIVFAHLYVGGRLNTLTVFDEMVDAVLTIVETNGLETVTIPNSDSTPQDTLERIEEQLVAIDKGYALLVQESASYTHFIPALEIASDYLTSRKENEGRIADAPVVANVCFFEGWIRADAYSAFLNACKEAHYAVSVERRALRADEVVPVEITNNRFITPFESVTRLYGLPGPKDLDPTPFLAGFFFIFFGLCLTDVGYGLFLALVTGSLLFSFRFSEGVRTLLGLLCFGGIASMLAGLFFGGYLGISVDMLPKPLADLQYFDPIANPLPVLFLALGLGVVQILFGLCLNVWRAKRSGELKEGLFDSGPWILLFVSGIYALLSTTLLESATPFPASWPLLLSVVLIILSGGRKEKNIFAKVGKGVLSLYDAIAYFSDILSYSRILALGLATTALAFAVNLISELIGDMVPYVGGILAIIILIVGHLFTVAVNVLGAFIHSARLQFVEFFGKFITTSGRAFRPIRESAKYIIINR